QRRHPAIRGHPDDRVVPLSGSRLRRVVHRGPRVRDHAGASRRAPRSRGLPSLRVTPMRSSNPARVAAAVAARLALAGPLPLEAQQPITLPQAVALAQERGLQAQAARAARDAARYRSGAFTARLLPQLFLGGTVPSYNRSIIPVLQPDGSTLFRPQDQTNAALSLSLSQTLPVTGGDLFITSSLARLTVSGPQAIETWSSTPVTIGLRQDILRPNVAEWNRREHAVSAELAERQYREVLEDIALP